MRNISHGCVGMSEAGARYFYETMRTGDIVDIRNTDGGSWTRRTVSATGTWTGRPGLRKTRASRNFRRDPLRAGLAGGTEHSARDSASRTRRTRVRYTPHCLRTPLPEFRTRAKNSPSYAQLRVAGLLAGSNVAPSVRAQLGNHPSTPDSGDRAPPGGQPPFVADRRP